MNNDGSGALTEIILIVILTLINAFFSAAEIAIISLNKSKIAHMADEGDARAKILEALVEEPSKLLATIQVGITLAGFLASASAAVGISSPLAEFLRKTNINILSHASNQIALITVTILLAFLTLVLGELLPKRLALQHSEGIAMFSAKPISIASKILAPFVKILTVTTALFAKLLGTRVEDTEDKVTEEEIRLMIDVGQENGVLNENEKEMIDGIFEFNSKLAKEVMTPRTSVFAIDIETPVEELVDSILEERYTRIPVFEEDIDNIIGILYVKDLFTYIRNRNLEDLSIINLLRPAYFVPETKNIDALFREMQYRKNHMAILIDEYGGVSGILTIEDLIEEIMGNISDEDDEDIREIEKIDDNTYIINGRTNISDINDELDLDIPSENFDTIGGFVIDLIGSIPNEHEEHVIEYKDIIIKIEKVSEKRIEQIKLYKQTNNEGEEE